MLEGHVLTHGISTRISSHDQREFDTETDTERFCPVETFTVAVNPKPFSAGVPTFCGEFMSLLRLIIPSSCI